MAHSKEQNKFPEVDPKEMGIYELPKRFKIIVLKKLKVLQESTDGQINEIRKMLYEQNENINNEIETIKKKNRNSGIKNVITELKNFTRGVQQQTLIKQKKESANPKTGHLKLYHQRNKNKKA